MTNIIMIAINRKSEIFALVLAAFVGTFLAIYTSNQKSSLRIFSASPVTQSEIFQPVSPLAKTPDLPKTEFTSQISQDGTKRLIMKTTYNKDNTQTYTFSTADNSGDEDGIISNEQTIFTKTLDNTKIMSLPFNTWSPDNKYFFIQEQIKDTNTVTGTFVYKALGESFANEEENLDVIDSFIKRNTGNNFNIATGWASETLIIFNTTKPDNTKGPSYWFEVPGKAVIQLSTEF